MSSTRYRPIAVVGAGIVGCATAYMLTNAGHDVILFDREGELAAGASKANGAQLSYSFVEPLATPSVLKKLVPILLGRDPALRFRPQASLAQLRWGYEFLSACRSDRVVESTQRLLSMAEVSRVEMQAFVESGAQFDYRQPGKLVLLENDAAMDRAAATVELQRKLGTDQELIERARCIEIEPALTATAFQFRGAVWSAGDALCDPRKLCAHLIQRCAFGRLELRLGTGVLTMRMRGQELSHLETSAGPYEVSRVVITAGVDAPTLVKSLGLKLPIQPIKGYSVTLPAEIVKRMPRVSVTDLARKIVYAPLGNALRVAGFAEVGQRDTGIDAHQIAALVSATRERFGLSESNVDIEPWAGQRPATPSSLPIVGRAKIPNVYLNVGHGALGLTLALGAARMLERSITSEG